MRPVTPARLAPLRSRPGTGGSRLWSPTESPRASATFKSVAGAVKTAVNIKLLTTFLCSFNNFCWLHSCLVKKYGSVVVIPPIPESVLYGDLEDELIEKRRVGFQKFASRISRHPVLSISEAWKLFITETNNKVSAVIKNMQLKK